MFEDQPAMERLLPPETELMTVQPGVIGPGSFLIQSWVVCGLPKSVLLETQIFGHWQLVVTSSAREIEDQLAEAGWHCCAMAPAIEASAFGCDDDVVNRALNRLVQVTNGDSNAIEITGISTMHSSWGWTMSRCPLWQDTSRKNPFPAHRSAWPEL